jgi:hypothetical protein
MMIRPRVKLRKEESQDKSKRLKLMKAYLVGKVPKKRKMSISIELVNYDNSCCVF